jgi:hypothetical protein
MSEEGPYQGRVNQRRRPMVLLPRVNAQNTKSGQEQHRMMGSVVHDVLLYLSTLDVGAVALCARRATLRLSPSFC